MTPRAYRGLTTVLSVAGVAFSGYLSVTRMWSGTCAFDEPCPFFLGQPACYTGFALFAGALVVSLAAWLFKSLPAPIIAMHGAVGLAGTLFAAVMTSHELYRPVGYRLGLPTCAYGLLFFVALLGCAVAAWLARARSARRVPGETAFTGHGPAAPIHR